MTDNYPIDGGGSGPHRDNRPDGRRPRSYSQHRPVIQPLRDDDSSSSSPRPSSLSSLPQRPFQHRPPTPPFPLPSTTGKKGAKSTFQPKMNRQAYARLLARLSLEQDHEDNLPRSRSRSNSNSDGALPAVLRLLAHETARADAAERELTKDSEALLTRVKDAKEARERTELELIRVREELNLYKLQLAVAQSEIDRAQKIVAEVERARVAAEDRGTKDRDRIRRLVAERAAEIAREEGRNEGWKQGLERGRWVAWTNREMRRREREEREDDDGSSTSSERTSRARRSRARERDGAREHERARSSARNAAPNAEIPPNRPPSTSQRPVPNPVPVPTPFRSPEDISIQHPPSRAQTPRSPSRSSVRTVPRSPSVASRRSRSRSIPPDGYIPTIGPDAFISLPPPFELSQPVDFSAKTGEEASASAGGVSRSEGERKDPDRQSERGGQRAPSLRTRDYVYGPASGLRQPTYDDVFRDKGKGKGTPAVSTASTRFSQYDLISPPERERGRDRERRGRVAAGGDYRQMGATSSQVASERVEAWRAASPSVVASPTPTTPTRASASGPRSTSAMSSMYANPIEDPVSRPQTSNSSKIYSPRVTGSPRLPQENNIGSPRSQSRENNGSGSGPAASSNSIYRPSKTTETHPLQQSHVPPPQPSPSAENPNQQRYSIYATPTPTRPRQSLERSFTSTTVPDIDVEPPTPSQTNSSATTTVDQRLLTPDHRPAPLVEDTTSGSHEPQSTVYSPIPQQQQQGGDPPTVVLPDNNIPPGFMPLSPIPSISNFNASDHDPHRMHEQYQGGGYQIYAAPAVVSDTASIRMGMGTGSRIPFSSSLLFMDSEPPRPSTAAGTSAERDTTRRRTGDHDPHEQYHGSGHQIYAAPAVVSDSAGNGTRMGMGMGSRIPFSSSLLFMDSEPPRPSTAAGTSTPVAAERDVTGRRMSFVTSPAPLDRPISIFSDT